MISLDIFVLFKRHNGRVTYTLFILFISMHYPHLQLRKSKKEIELAVYRILRTPKETFVAFVCLQLITLNDILYFSFVYIRFALSLARHWQRIFKNTEVIAEVLYNAYITAGFWKCQTKIDYISKWVGLCIFTNNFPFLWNITFTHFWDIG